MSTAPPIPPELLQVTQRLRLPYLRRHAAEVIATAKAQRWDPAEVVRVPARGGGQRPRRRHPAQPAQSSRLSLRQDFRGLGS